jgi:hypothetical protein
MRGLLFTVISTLLVLVLFLQLEPGDTVRTKEENHQLDKRTRADLAMQQEWEMTHDPETGTIPRERLWQAAMNQKQLMSKHAKSGGFDITWMERGPKNVGGRTRTIMVDPNDSTGNTVFAASVSGGVWKTTNFYNALPEWEVVDDFLANMAVTTLAHHPSGTDTFYLGTGEGFYNSDAVQGDGIFKSVDGGENWTQLSSTTGSSFNYVQKLVVTDGNVILAATRDGVQRSTDGGSSWTKTLGSSVGGGSTNRIADLEIDANGNIWAAAGIFSTDGIYKSNNDGLTWTKMYTSTSVQGRIELGCAPSDSNRIYAIIQNTNTNRADAIKKSTNGGSSWSDIAVPIDAVSSDTFTRQQAWYDLSIAVDPADEDVLYVGGIDLFKSTNAGSSWTQVSHWYGGGGYPEVHADQHFAAYIGGSSDTLIFGNDGGVYFTLNGTSSTPSFTHQVLDYNTVQFYACAIAPDRKDNHYLGGTQDNGSHRFDYGGVNSTVEVTGGDGAFTHIDQDDDSYQFTSYVYNQYRRSTDGGQSFSNVNFSSSLGRFINPTDYDNDTHILYAAYSSGNYLRWTNPRSGTSASGVSAGFTGQVSAVTCDPNTSNRVYFGTGSGKVYQVDDANTTASVTDVSSGSFPSGYVSCIEVENGDPDHLLVTFSNYGVTSVWESTNAGSSWTAVEGDLPDIPVRWALFSPVGGDTALLATELGVYATTNLNGGSTSWSPCNTGLANVRTDMLQFRESDSLILAATHGRGMYSTYAFSNTTEANFTSDFTVAYTGESIEFYDNSLGATSWEWDFDNDGIYDDSGSVVQHAYATSGTKTVVLRINGSDTVQKSDYITILPNLGVPYSTSDGGNFESNANHFGSKALSGATNLWELGAPSNYLSGTNSGSNVWKTDLDADIAESDYECALYTPCFNFSNTSGSYFVSFYASMERYYSNAPFGIQMQYSTDGGTSWSRLGDSGDTTNWYERGSSNPHGVIDDGRSWSFVSSSFRKMAYNVTSLRGNERVCFRFFAKVQTGWGGGGSPTYTIDGFSIDDFEVTGPSNDPLNEEIETLTSQKTVDLDPQDTVDFLSPNGKLIATVANLDGSHDYGSTVVEIDNAGGGVSNFDTNTVASEKIFSKTVKITPTTNNASGVVRISLYYTKAEFDAWKSATGLWGKDLQLFKTTNAVGSSTMAQGVYPDSSSVDTTYNGEDVCLIGWFSNGFSGVGAGGGASGGGGPLPVELIHFSGQYTEAGNHLKWITASEVNNDRFEIERSESGEGFYRIAQIDGMGTTQEVTQYEYVDRDHTAVQTVYYRLKQIDFDGSYDYSNVVSIRRGNVSNEDITIRYAANSWNITGVDENCVARVYDVGGHLVRTKPLRRGTVSQNGLPAGVYVIELERNGRPVKRFKVLKR